MVGRKGGLYRGLGLAANGSGGKGLSAEHLVTNPQVSCGLAANSYGGWGLSTKVVGGMSSRACLQIFNLQIGPCQLGRY
jgi:hypothetical protein